VQKPLADRLRPETLDEIVGQNHLLDKGKMLRRIIEAGEIPNMVFYGPSGIGKTTLARIIATTTNRTLHKLNGTTASTADIKSVMEEIGTFAAQNGVLLYLDEIQYFNKKQQQSLLEYIENGKITLIASTTENPYFYVYNAILSRSTVFEFKPVTKDEIKKAVIRAFKFIENERDIVFELPSVVVETISISCGGDVRKAINAVELISFAATEVNGKYVVTLDDAEQVAQRSNMRYDRDGDEHYDILSAFQKSIRGSDENAALHYLGRLVEAGDLPSICRRLLVIAAEDIGLAYPQGIVVAKSCIDAALQLGFPEARIPLAEAVILLATAPKSHSAATAIDAAMDDIKAGKSGDIPIHLKDAHYEGAKKLGRGIQYKYPHSFDGNWIAQQYLPDTIKDAKYYEHGNNKSEQAAKAYWENVKGKK
jgi:putative ATPase